MSKTRSIRPVILSGGSGTRMWPISRKAQPKQFHALASDKSLLQETATRFTGDVFSKPIILANHKHKDLIDEHMAAINITPAMVILEPTPRNTAPAIAALALAAQAENPGDVLAVFPADHAIKDPNALQNRLLAGLPAAQDGAIVTFGVTPDLPETGYGYIRAGEPIAGDTRSVSAFVEKPDLETAKQYLASGDYVWNAGIFMFRADIMVSEMQAYCPQILEAAQEALDKADRAAHHIALDADAFNNAPEDSIDYAVMEHTARAGVVEISIGWSDIGSWSTLWSVNEKDDAGCVSKGEDEAIMIDCQNVLAISEGPKIATIGMQDIVVIATDKGVLIAPHDRTQDVKKVVEQLKKKNRTDLL